MNDDDDIIEVSAPLQRQQNYDSPYGGLQAIEAHNRGV